MFINEWYEKHNATLIKYCENGFYYMNAIWDWYILYNGMSAWDK